jgi:ribonucleoside-diphosphate reductase alpha chain
MRFLDNVIDDTYYFYKENEKVAKDIRRTGLGILGLADALIKMKLRYGAPESEETLKKIFKTLRDSAYEASAEIAKEKGAFPKFEKEKYLKGYHIQNLPKEIQTKIAKNGIRNAVLLTIAPTGTTSLISGVSSGVEPVYEFEFIRRDRLGEHKMYHPLYEEWKNANPNAEKPEYFVSANDLTPEEHVMVQAIAQEYIDSSISKTVNAPNAHSVEDVKNLYMLAYDNGLKGITYMRDGSREGVLSRVEEKKEEKPAVVVPQNYPRAPRPMMVEGVTYKTQTPVGDTYITLNHDQQGEPFEVFITIGKSGSDVAAMADALGRMISLNLRLAGNLPPRERIRQVISQLSGIGGARSVGFGENRVRSLPDAIAKVLAKQYAFKVNGVVEDKLVPTSNGNGHVEAPVSVTADVPAPKEEITVLQQLPLQEGITMESKPKTHSADICPECGVSSFVYEEGCGKCYSCGHSEC